MFKLCRNKHEIREQCDRATEWTEKEESAGSWTYEEGALAMLRWLLDEDAKEPVCEYFDIDEYYEN